MEITNKEGKFIKPILKTNKPLTGKRFYIKRLMETLERTFWQVNGVVKDWTEDMLADSLHYCETYSNVKLRNVKFNEYLKDTKVDKST